MRDVVARFRRATERAWGATGAPGLSAAIVERDGATEPHCLGFADPDTGVPMRPATRLLSGSIGKTYVAALVLDLVRESVLDLDDRVSRHLGAREWFERLPNAETLTLRYLLRHESGLARYVFRPALWKSLVEDPDRVRSPEELVGLVLDEPALFPAGEGWAYSDTNYLVVGMIVEQATGARFYDLARERLLAPLGLEDTIPSDSRRIPGVAQGSIVRHRDLGLPARTLQDGEFTFCNHFEWCGGGWASTAVDLARWITALAAGDVVPEPHLAQMLDAVPSPPLGDGARYGLGLTLWDSPAGAVIGHEGTMPGFLAVTGFAPALQLGVAVMLNSDDCGDYPRMSVLLLDVLRSLETQPTRGER